MNISEIMKEESIDGAQAPNQTENKSKESIESSQQENSKQEDTDEIVIENEQSEIEKITQEHNELKDKHLRLYSEFENFRRRTAKERLELISSANADLVASVLPVLDDFERAIEAADKADSNVEQEGVNLIYQKLLKELNKKGLKPMDDLEGTTFDAEIHEAISQVPAPKKKLKDRIIHVVEKGYYLNEKVIRYAKVVIGT